MVFLIYLSIATLGSIFDPQLSFDSRQFQKIEPQCCIILMEPPTHLALFGIYSRFIFFYASPHKFFFLYMNFVAKTLRVLNQNYLEAKKKKVREACAEAQINSSC